MKEKKMSSVKIFFYLFLNPLQYSCSKSSQNCCLIHLKKNLLAPNLYYCYKILLFHSSYS